MLDAIIQTQMLMQLDAYDVGDINLDRVYVCTIRIVHCSYCIICTVRMAHLFNKELIIYKQINSIRYKIIYITTQNIKNKHKQ